VEFHWVAVRCTSDPSVHLANSQAAPIKPDLRPEPCKSSEQEALISVQTRGPSSTVSKSAMLEELNFARAIEPERSVRLTDEENEINRNK
jgi:hypothetical protein